SGPIFTQVLLADEINRATPKTQSALLEAMEERQVTVEGSTRPLPQPFFVIATQNPIEQAGTFPLPDSQLDRFLIRMDLGYPGRDAERALLHGGDTKLRIPDLTPVLDGEEILAIQSEVDAIHASPALVEYVLDLAAFTRESELFHVGLSPRAALGLLRASQSRARLHGRDHVLPEDVQRVLPWATSHRLRSARDMRQFPLAELSTIFEQVALP
ncbi:MAG: MoxR family ATPase, partial [Desulfovibrio sp.]